MSVGENNCLSFVQTFPPSIVCLNKHGLDGSPLCSVFDVGVLGGSYVSNGAFLWKLWQIPKADVKIAHE